MAAPEVYAVTSYTDVELSAAMGERAQATVEAAGHDNFRVVAGDVTCVESGWTEEARHINRGRLPDGETARPWHLWKVGVFAGGRSLRY